MMKAMAFHCPEVLFQPNLMGHPVQHNILHYK
jgi:hypothetical protein